MDSDWWNRSKTIDKRLKTKDRKGFDYSEPFCLWDFKTFIFWEHRHFYFDEHLYPAIPVRTGSSGRALLLLKGSGIRFYRGYWERGEVFSTLNYDIKPYLCSDNFN